MKFGKTARGAVGYLLEFVTDIVMNADGTIDAKGADDRDVSAAVGWHFGFYSRPKDGSVGVTLNFMGMSLLIAYRDQQFEMSLEKGEVGMQNAFSASMLLDKNGNVIQKPGGSGKVRLGDLATTDDAVLGTSYRTALNNFLTSFTTFNTALKTLTNALVPTTGVTPGAPATFATASGVMDGAVSALKSANYLSSTVALK